MTINNMKTTLQNILQMFVTGITCVPILGILVLLVGWIVGWHTATEFSNGMFVTGSAIIIFGLLSVWGGFTSRGSFAITYAQSTGDMSLAERAKLWTIDSLRGYNVIVVTTIIGLIMIGLAILIYNLFG